jgi:Glycosyl transferase family 2
MTSKPADIAVDVVIDNYNYDAFLGAAIESARGQTHPRVNVIVVDDGSTDSSHEVLRGFDGEIEAVLKENGGQASALNAGLDRCRGDVVIFLDADDVLHPQAAARVAAAFAADERLVKVQYRMDTIDDRGKSLDRVKPAPHLPMPSGDLRDEELASPYDLVWMATSGNAFRTAAIRRVFPIPEAEYRICADWYLVHLTTLLGAVASLEEVCASYRLHGSNNYEPQAARLDVAHMRENVALAQSTSRALLDLAAELEIERPERILSIADLANRMVSLRLEPELHPVPGDSAGRLVRDAVHATRRRGGISAPMKAMFVAWFAAMAVSPPPLARRLATLFLFPQTRAGFNRVLGRLHRDG